MAGLMYFLPGGHGNVVGLDSFKALGLEAVFPTPSFSRVGVTRGPAAGGGMVVTHPPEDPDGKEATPGMYPERQEWREANGYWVGRYTDEPVRPEDLRRSEVISGHWVKLADGQQWLVPVARAFPSGTSLPRTLKLGPDGQLVREVLPRFAAIWGKAEAFWAQWMAANTEVAQDAGIDEKEAFLLATEALALNYRVGPAEVSLLGLLTTANVVEVLQALIDVPALVAHARLMRESKKNETSSAPVS